MGEIEGSLKETLNVVKLNEKKGGGNATGSALEHHRPSDGDY
jgi:hypothetical protein